RRNRAWPASLGLQQLDELLRMCRRAEAAAVIRPASGAKPAQDRADDMHIGGKLVDNRLPQRTIARRTMQKYELFHGISCAFASLDPGSHNADVGWFHNVCYAIYLCGGYLVIRHMGKFEMRHTRRSALSRTYEERKLAFSLSPPRPRRRGHCNPIDNFISQNPLHISQFVDFLAFQTYPVLIGTP